MKKRAISLIEVIVSLSLLSVLLGTLFFWYRSFTRQKEEFNRLKWPLMEERYAHQRLNYILPTAESPFFTTLDKKDLVFIFDRGPSIAPELSGKVLARLYHDPIQKCLCLGIWPKPTQKNNLRSPSQSLILLDGVSECSFEFYHPPDPFRKPVDPEEVGKLKPREGWQREWKSSFHTLPALVKIHITRDPAKGIKEHSFDYVFDLPVTLIYPKGTV